MGFIPEFNRDCYTDLVSGIDEEYPHIVIKVIIAPGGMLTNDAEPLFANVKPISIKAVVDTGATMTAISRKMVHDLKLEPYGNKRNVITAAGMLKNQPTYLMDLRVLMSPVSNQKKMETCRDFQYHEVGPFGPTIDSTDPNPPPPEPALDGIEMLLGMDVITQGLLEVKGSKFTICLPDKTNGNQGYIRSFFNWLRYGPNDK